MQPAAALHLPSCSPASGAAANGSTAAARSSAAAAAGGGPPSPRSAAAAAVAAAVLLRRAHGLWLWLFAGGPLAPFDGLKHGAAHARAAPSWHPVVASACAAAAAAGLAAGWAVGAPDAPFAARDWPLTAPAAPFAAVALYLAGLHALRAAVAGMAAGRRVRLEAHLRPVVAAHNALLSLWSAALLAGLCYRLGPLLSARGGLVGDPVGALLGVWCDPKPHALASHPLLALCYLNYLVKWYELGDTALLVLRGRPTPLLHVFHHAATLVLCWLQLVENTACQWLPIVLNLGVHVLMYGYYAAATLGLRVWWKRYLTTLQIVQFSVGVPSCVAALALRVAAERGVQDLPGLRGRGSTWCRGTHRAAYVGIGLLFAYLLLFLQLYRELYCGAAPTGVQTAAHKAAASPRSSVDGDAGGAGGGGGGGARAAQAAARREKRA